MEKREIHQVLYDIRDVEELIALHETQLFKYPGNKKLIESHTKLMNKKKELDKELNDIEFNTSLKVD